jgi:hypothetical protein
MHQAAPVPMIAHRAAATRQLAAISATGRRARRARPAGGAAGRPGAPDLGMVCEDAITAFPALARSHALARS